MLVEPDDLRVAMRRWATGVTIVTAAHNGIAGGMTVTSFTSVSLTPPQVLVCIERGTRTHEAITESGAFAVSFLNENQQDWSMRFGGQLDDIIDDNRFDGIRTETYETDSPVLEGASAFLDCRVVAAHAGGTHTVFIGQVQASGVADGDRAPLLYYGQTYHHLADGT